jgi:hypothetical protein
MYFLIGSLNPLEAGQIHNLLYEIGPRKGFAQQRFFGLIELYTFGACADRRKRGPH